MLWNSDNKSKVEEWNDTQAVAKTAGLPLVSVVARTSGEIESAFASILRERPNALLTLTETLTLHHAEQIGHFVLSNRVPMFAELREFAAAGGLASYGASRPDMWRQAAGYVVKIMHGARPADLPIQQPVKFEVVINLKAANGASSSRWLAARQRNLCCRPRAALQFLDHLITFHFRGTDRHKITRSRARQR